MTLLATAFNHHRMGSLAEAANGYRTVLASSPENPDAMHLLGVVSLQQGDPPGAADLIARAIALRPTEAAYHSNLAEAYRLLGRADRAISEARFALQLKPDFPEALNVLGLSLTATGRAEEAVSQFRAAIELAPGFAAALNNLGNAQLVLKDKDAARESFRRAVEVAPSYAEARSNLGQLLNELGEPEEAEEHCRAAVQLRPAFAEAISNLGNALRQLNRLDEAKQHYEEAIRLAPGLGMVHNNMGQALQEEGDFAGAIARYHEALRLEPDSARFHTNLASAYADQERDEEAAGRFEVAIRFDPDYAAAHVGLGGVRRDQARASEAQACYERALAIDPELAGGHCGLAGLAEERGDFASALAGFRRAQELAPDHCGAVAQVAHLLKAKTPDADLATMHRLLADPKTRPSARSSLHFGMAQVLDARGDFAAAAEHLDVGNRLAADERRRIGQAYDPVEHDRLVAAILATATAKNLAALRSRGVGSDSERPVFIVGMPRSGTTLTEQVLASHPRVHGAGELPLGREAFMGLPGATGLDLPAADCLPRLSREVAGRLVDAHLARLAALDAGADRVVDKMPDNYLYLGLLATLFPRARFIHCRRDVRDVAVSCWMTNFERIPWADEFGHIANRIAGYRQLTEHWQSALPVEVLDVHYEEMVTDLEGQARRLVAWCGLDWDPACLAFHLTKRSVRTASVTQVRQPIYGRSVARWRHYEPALSPLFEALNRPA